MIVRLLASLLVVAVLTAGAHAAEDLVSGVSTDLIQIQSDFTGTDIVVFGAIEGFDPGMAPEDRAIVVAVRGPDVPLTVRHKERIVGIWVTTEQAQLEGMPGYYFVTATRPLELIAPPEALERFELGISRLRATPPPGTGPEAAIAFRAAAARALQRQAMYWENANTIEFLSRSLFRARIPIPATVPPGEYRAEVYLFHRGTVVSAQSSPMFVDKTGFERELYDFSYEASFAYGLVAVTLSFLFGWLGFALFRPR